MRKQQIAIFRNSDNSMDYFCLGTETPEQATNRLQKEGKRDILIIEVKLAYWSV